jgi:hypothetical protein
MTKVTIKIKPKAEASQLSTKLKPSTEIDQYAEQLIGDIHEELSALHQQIMRENLSRRDFVDALKRTKVAVDQFHLNKPR